MSSLYLSFLFLIVIAQRSSASYPFGVYGGMPMVHAPVAISALPAPVAFAHPVHHSAPIEVHNLMRTSDRETGHFSGTMHRSFGYPFNKKN
ncbi:hypothetical protein RB195_004306 [Necator americanus]|uniref:Uncharacterized protein n=1 Tax=Necator americanus TaxID=51031 RepID=A0ABR1BHB8_NECAM